jgi:hypothetical protein
LECTEEGYVRVNNKKDFYFLKSKVKTY